MKVSLNNIHIRWHRHLVLSVSRQGSESEVGLDGTSLRELSLGSLVRDSHGDNSVIGLALSVLANPVDGAGNTVLVAGLQTDQGTQHFQRVTAERGRVSENESHLLVGGDDEHRANSEGQALGVNVGGVLVKHTVGDRNLTVGVSNDGEGQVRASDLVDVLNPLTVRGRVVNRQTKQLGVSLGELGLEQSEGTQLGGADGGVVTGVGQQNHPAVANVLVEVNLAGGGLGSEVGGGVAESQDSLGVLVNRSHVS